MNRKSDEIFAELKSAIRAEIIEVLLGGQQVTRPRLGRPPGKANKPAKKGWRKPAEIEKITKNMLGYIKKNPDQTLREIGAGMNLNAADLHFPSRKLREGKAVSIKGTGSGMRYRVKG